MTTQNADTEREVLDSSAWLDALARRWERIANDYKKSCWDCVYDSEDIANQITAFIGELRAGMESASTDQAHVSQEAQ